ncbi:MAG: tyrosine--tRNA ligase, partial [Oscillospiraceae bacterium]|nr:tyrosine--tRNA ligase [Oscillospiraceae bacterium]
EVQGMTFQLLTTKEGKKMGKTEGGAVWLNPTKTTPYDFFQYWRNVGDDDVIKCLKFLTFIPVEEIEEMEKTFEGANINACKERLAYEVTKIVHGEEEAAKALEAARAIFAGKGSSENMPTVSFTEADFADGKLAVTEALIRAEMAKSKGEGKRLIEQGGITVNDEKITDVFATIDRSAFDEGEVILKKGKKIFKKLIIVNSLGIEEII